MELIYYTIAALVLYGVSDFILNSIEIRMGKRLPNRSFIFLIIITILAMVSFNLIRAIFAPLEPAQQTTNTQTEHTIQAPLLPSEKQTKH